MFSIYDATFYSLETLLNLFVIFNVLYGITLILTMQIFYFKKITTKWDRQLTDISNQQQHEDSAEYEESEDFQEQEEDTLLFNDTAFDDTFNNAFDDDLFNSDLLRA